ncbi:MAG: site-specific integrase [Candidatus Ancillula sp.]|nr:site-specific integrase [Candidatus Ancillula sp.]
MIDLCEHALAELLNVTRHYKDSLEKITVNLGWFGEMKADEVMHSDITHWVQEELDRGLQIKTVWHKVRFVKSAYHLAFDSGYVEINPFNTFKLPKGRHTEMTTLSSEEFSNFLNFIHPHYRLFVKALVLTGLRFGEITALQYADFDFEHNTVRISKAWGDHNRYMRDPKTASGVRTIALPRKLTKELQAISQNKDDEYVFTNQRGKRLKYPTFESRYWIPATKLFNGNRCVLPKWIREEDKALPVCKKHLRIHDLRHTCATWMLSENIPIHVVSHHLGHASIEMTVKRYGHIMNKDFLLVTKVLSQLQETL